MIDNGPNITNDSFTPYTAACRLSEHGVWPSRHAAAQGLLRGQNPQVYCHEIIVYVNLHVFSSHVDFLSHSSICSLSEEGTISEEPESLGVDSVDELTPRTSLPPLLSKLTERRAERLDYIGVSFGLTEQLLRFWKHCGFVPVYLRQTQVSAWIL